MSNGSMDIAAQRATYAGFLKLMTMSTIISIGVIALLALTML